MLYGLLSDSESSAPLVTDPVWAEAFAWLRALPRHPEPGHHAIRGEELFASVMRYATVSRLEARFESHRRYVDLQYVIAGGEWIECCSTCQLSPAGDYDSAADLQFYAPRPTPTLCDMTPGSWAVFYPADAHRPKISNGSDPEVFKLVIKVRRDLLQG